jgi:(p)ppGpp synthase/HD superfamily hydrolase
MEARVHDLADGAPDGPACRGVDASTMTKGYSLIDKAATIAAIVHRRQHRKATSVPYFVHPAQVALILARHGYPDILQAAGMLHDVLEDADPDDAETRRVLADLFGGLDDDASDAHAYRRALAACLRREVGPAVVTLVEAVSEVKTDRWPQLLKRKRQALAIRDAATPTTCCSSRPMCSTTPSRSGRASRPRGCRS